MSDLETKTWCKAWKKPVQVEYRTVTQKEEIETREGKLFAFPNEDYIIRGVEGEVYPIKKGIFDKTYSLINPLEDEQKERSKLIEEFAKTQYNNECAIDGNLKKIRELEQTVKIQGELFQVEHKARLELEEQLEQIQRIFEWHKEHFRDPKLAYELYLNYKKMIEELEDCLKKETESLNCPKEADVNTIERWKNDVWHTCDGCPHPPEKHYSARVKGTISKIVNWCSVPYCRCKGYSD